MESIESVLIMNKHNLLEKATYFKTTSEVNCAIPNNIIFRPNVLKRARNKLVFLFALCARLTSSYQFLEYRLSFIHNVFFITFLKYVFNQQYLYSYRSDAKC